MKEFKDNWKRLFKRNPMRQPLYRSLEPAPAPSTSNPVAATKQLEEKVERVERCLRERPKSVDIMKQRNRKIFPFLRARVRAPSAPPTFPDTDGMQLYPNETVCAYAWCRKRRLYPRLYCKRHSCRARNCGRAILQRFYEVPYIPLKHTVHYDSALPGSDEISYTQQPYEVEDLFCIKHICAEERCKSKRSTGKKYCLTHQCQEPGCERPKPAVNQLFCDEHIPQVHDWEYAEEDEDSDDNSFAAWHGHAARPLMDDLVGE